MKALLVKEKSIFLKKEIFLLDLAILNKRDKNNYPYLKNT